MTIPNPCTSSDQPAAEYGVAQTAACPDAYYGLPGIPGSGPLSSDDFSGKSNVTFTPDGGDAGGIGTGTATCTLLCSQSAVWTYSGGGAGGSVNISSGSSATSITFTVTAPGAGTVTVVWTVSGTAAGVTRNFTVTVDAMGTG